MEHDKDLTGRINQAELSRRLKVSRATVSKAVKAGRITPDEDGLFDPIEAELEWIANTRTKASGSQKPSGSSSGYAKARARKEDALARMAELRYEQATGNLVGRSQVEFVMSDHAEFLRGLLDALPDRMAAGLLARRDIESIRQYLSDELHQVQVDLADNLRRRSDDHFSPV